MESGILSIQEKVWIIPNNIFIESKNYHIEFQVEMYGKPRNCNLIK